MFTNENIIRCRKKIKARLGIGILSLFVMLAVLGVVAFEAKNKMAAEKSMEEVYQALYEADRYDPVQVAYIDTQEEVVSFAGTDDEKELYDVVMDKDGFLYVLKLSGKQEKAINDSVAQTGSAHIRGVTSEFRNSDARRILLEQMQEGYPEENITEENLDDITGYLQLNVKNINILSVMGSANGWYALALIVAFIVAVFLIPTSIFMLGKEKKLGMDEVKMLDEEMSAGASWMPTLEAYATENYVIGAGSGVVPCRYSDILMIYKEVHRYNGIKTSENIKVLDKRGNVIDIANISVNSFQRIKSDDINSELEYLGNRIREANENVYLGYNQQVLRDLQKRAKNGEFMQ